ncbi:MAG: hypothetical protein R3E96_06125 [Planctomycetota bacterium]
MRIVPTATMRLSRNEIFENGGLGIDLIPPALPRSRRMMRWTPIPAAMAYWNYPVLSLAG